MNNRQLSQLGLRLIGVWTGVSAVEGFLQIAGLFAMAGGGGPTPLQVALAVGVPLLLMLALSYALVFHSADIANAVLLDADGQAGMPLQPHDLAHTLVVLTGVLLVVQGVPGVVGAIFNLVPVGSEPTSMRTIPGLVSGIVRGVVGLYLIKRPGRVLGIGQPPLPEPIG